ncbi:uncharacterized protein [Bemisia tabaci]|uniref:uncharacterized protein n=1 Tax=Bemisia tabaci TaxID=7038 RepID=UPI003B27B7D7
MVGSSAWCVSLPRKSLQVNLISHNFLASAVFLTLFLATSDSKTLEDPYLVRTLNGEKVPYNNYRDYHSPNLGDELDPVFYEFNFDPVRLEEKLIRAAHFNGTSPSRFHLELRMLVDCAMKDYTDYDTVIKQCRNNQYIDIVHLEKKYYIEDAALPSPWFEDFPTQEQYNFFNKITHKKLIMMFPQYLRFHHMKLDRKHFDSACRHLDKVLPKIMKYPEFAGFLPTLDDKTLQIGRIKELIGVYLFWQFCNVAQDERTEEHFGKIKKMTLKRIEASRLPNAERVRFLRANDILPRDDEKWEKEPKLDEKYLEPFDSLPFLVQNAAAERKYEFLGKKGRGAFRCSSK